MKGITRVYSCRRSPAQPKAGCGRRTIELTLRALAHVRLSRRFLIRLRTLASCSLRALLGLQLRFGDLDRFAFSRGPFFRCDLELGLGRSALARAQTRPPVCFRGFLRSALELTLQFGLRCGLLSCTLFGMSFGLELERFPRELVLHRARSCLYARVCGSGCRFV
jgi:hypothetical protein